LFIRSKIQFFESKSQRYCRFPSVPVCCLSDQRYNFLKANHNGNGSSSGLYPVVYQIKDTIFWKQITTPESVCRSDRQLFIRSKIQFFESKSQLIERIRSQHPCCLSDQRYNFLKANHN